MDPNRKTSYMGQIDFSSNQQGDGSTPNHQFSFHMQPNTVTGSNVSNNVPGTTSFPFMGFPPAPAQGMFQGHPMPPGFFPVGIPNAQMTSQMAAQVPVGSVSSGQVPTLSRKMSSSDLPHAFHQGYPNGTTVSESMASLGAAQPVSLVAQGMEQSAATNTAQPSIAQQGLSGSQRGSSQTAPSSDLKRKKSQAPAAANKKKQDVACTSCRRRKIKCDHAKPVCNNCAKKNLGSGMCIYDDTPWISTAVKEKQLYDEINELKALNAELLNQHSVLKGQRNSLQDENIKLKKKLQMDIPDVPVSESKSVSNEELHVPNEILAHQFPFSERFTTVVKRDSDIRFYGPTCWKSMVSYDKKISFIYNQLAMMITEDKKKWEQQIREKRGPRPETPCRPKFSMISFSKEEDSQDIMLLNDYLTDIPSPAGMELYLNNFFSSFCKEILPDVLDKEEIMSDFRRLFQLQDKDLLKKKKFNYWLRIDPNDKYADIARVTRILLTVKFSILFGLNSYGDKVKAATRKLFYSYDGERMLPVIEAFLNASRFLEHTSIPALHSVSLLSIYMLYDPYFGSTSDVEASTFSSLFSIACRMAISMGLHKNIDELYFRESKAFRQKLKALWAVLMGYDGRQSLSLGIPLHIQEEYTYLPHDKFAELPPEQLAIIETLLLSRDVMRNLLMANKTTVNLYLQLEKLELFMTRKYRPMSDLIALLNQPKDMSEKSIYLALRELKNHFHIYCMYQSVYQMLYLAYTDKDKQDVNAQEQARKYRILTMKYSILLVRVSLEAFQAFKSLEKNYNLPYELVHYLLPILKEVQVKSVFFLFSILLSELQMIKSNPNTKVNSVDDLLDGKSISDLTTKELENTHADNQPQELTKLEKIFSNCSLPLMKFMYGTFVQVCNMSEFKVYQNSIELINFLHHFIVYLYERFDSLKFDLSFGNKNFLKDRLLSAQFINKKEEEEDETASVGSADADAAENPVPHVRDETRALSGMIKQFDPSLYNGFDNILNMSEHEFSSYFDSNDKELDKIFYQ